MMQENRKIVVDDGEFILSPISLNGMIALEEAELDPDSLQGVRLLLYHALLPKHPDITEEEAGRVVNFDNMKKIVEYLMPRGRTPKGKVKMKGGKATIQRRKATRKHKTA